MPQGTRRAMRLSFQCINSTGNSSLLRDPAPCSPRQPKSIEYSLRGSGGHFSPSNAHLAPLGRHLVHLFHHLDANMSKNASRHRPKIIFWVDSSPKMPQSSLPTTPKPQKTLKNLRFFKVFRYPAHVPKSQKNAPKTIPRPPKLS